MSGSERKYFAYLLRCSDGSLYGGYTVDSIEKRVETHNAGKGSRYTRSRLPVKLAGYKECETEHEARSLEWHIKHQSKQKKEALAASFGKEK